MLIIAGTILLVAAPAALMWAWMMLRRNVCGGHVLGAPIGGLTVAGLLLYQRFTTVMGQIHRIRGRYYWLYGAAKEYLEHLPPWPQEFSILLGGSYLRRRKPLDH